VAFRPTIARGLALSILQMFVTGRLAIKMPTSVLLAVVFSNALIFKAFTISLIFV
jgi:hypothetical protein